MCVNIFACVFLGLFETDFAFNSNFLKLLERWLSS